VKIFGPLKQKQQTLLYVAYFNNAFGYINENTVNYLETDIINLHY
jgi:CRISPR/Cas system CMR subunit Cmr6 (Cas7 group RAMP superfamily)